MALKPTSRRPVGKQVVPPRRKGKAAVQPPQRGPAPATRADEPDAPTAQQPATLAQQGTDFTAEGSPPPGRVANSTPAGPQTASSAGSAGKKR